MKKNHGHDPTYDWAKEIALKMYDSGYTAKQIADYTGINEALLAKIVSRRHT